MAPRRGGQGRRGGAPVRRRGPRPPGGERRRLGGRGWAVAHHAKRHDRRLLRGRGGRGRALRARARGRRDQGPLRSRARRSPPLRCRRSRRLRPPSRLRPEPGAAGGVLGRPAPRARPRAGSASVRSGRLVVFGAPRRANRIVARRQGAAWRVADAAAPLDAGRGCRRLSARSVSCRAAGVRSIALYGGDGDDRLSVIGRIRALLVGGRGRDRLTGGALAATSAGGPATDRALRRPR